MKTRLKLYVISFLMAIPALSSAKTPVAVVRATAPIEKCLNVATNVANDCIKQNLKNKTLSSCYALSETIYSYHSRERVRNYCFYNISEFPSLQTCTMAAQKFYLAENKDQALFECIRQFTSQISERSCLDTAKLMTFREKRLYLENHCRNL